MLQGRVLFTVNSPLFIKCAQYTDRKLGNHAVIGHADSLAEKKGGASDSRAALNAPPQQN